jgi:putative transcriptional regulator
MKTRLKVLRAGKDWTQQDLADRLDVSRQAVNALETDKHSPSLDLAYKIAALFDLPVEEIFDNPYRSAAKGKR